MRAALSAALSRVPSPSCDASVKPRRIAADDRIDADARLQADAQVSLDANDPVVRMRGLLALDHAADLAPRSPACRAR